MALTSSALVTFTLPTTYADGTTPWPAANYGGAVVLRDGVQIGTAAAPALVFIDTNIPAGPHSYMVQVKDSITGLFSAESAAFPYVQAVPAAQPPGPPTITSVVAH